MKINNPDPAKVARRRREFEPRVPLLRLLATNLDTEVRQALQGVKHVDRIAFREKDAESFAVKSLAPGESREQPKYRNPLIEIEDQVAGRVLVFFRRDIEVVVDRLCTAFSKAEQVHKAPKANNAFAYESVHLVLIIPPHCRPSGWDAMVDPPTTFEMQIRTLFMHAWAEPEHEISYKSDTELTFDEERRLAWAASSAWGGDEIFENVLDSIARRASGDGN